MSSDDPTVNRAFEGSPAPASGDQASAVPSLPAVADADDQRLDRLLPIGVSPLATRVRGRPKGAKNRRTDLVAEYLVERFGDPLTASMATAGMPLRELVTELRKIASDVGMKLGASVMDVARFQRDCRVDALPYIHAKRAPETAKGDPVLPVFAVGRFEQPRDVTPGTRRSLDDVIDENMQPEQQVIEHDAEVSHGEKSHDER